MNLLDMSNAARALTCYSHDTNKVHWNGALKILSQHGTCTFRITYREGQELELYTFADSSCTGDSQDRRSVSGEVMMFGGATVSWFSKMEKTVALSTQRQNRWLWERVLRSCYLLRYVLYFMQPKYGVPSVYALNDNCGTIYLVQNP
ncbi:unnamed protein product [Discosporangium mesarthrocarpum]